MIVYGRDELLAIGMPAGRAGRMLSRSTLTGLDGRPVVESNEVELELAKLDKVNGEESRWRGSEPGHRQN